MTGPAVEVVCAGEKGIARQRADRRVKRWLAAKRPVADEVDRLTSYRTEACVGYNGAVAEGALADVVAFLEAEHAWAMERLRAVAPRVAARFEEEETKDG